MSEKRVVQPGFVGKPDGFPFLWGVATSAHQIEGNNKASDWWDWESKGFIEGGVRSGAATDHLNRFKEDIQLAADLGVNSYRFSVEWARIEPEQGRFDQVALDWYLELIHECEKKGILPMVTLHHFSSPKWFAEAGGFTSESSPNLFLNFVKQVVRKIGGRVPLWCTFNEPLVLVIGSYLGKFMPPAEFSPRNAAKACHFLLKSHVGAYDYLHTSSYSSVKRQGPWRNIPLSVGIAHNMIDLLPDRSWHPIEQILARKLRWFYNQSWLDAINGRPQRFEIPFLFPKMAQVKEAIGRKTTDFIGINYYTKGYLRWRPRDQERDHLADELPINVSFSRRLEETTDMGWSIHSAGLSKMLKAVSSYKLPIFITENGIADREDKLRTSYILAHLIEIAKSHPIDVRGYFYWSLIDNFEWIKGFGPRFGLYHINYDNFQRTLRASALNFKEIIHAHKDVELGQPNLQILERMRDNFKSR